MLGHINSISSDHMQVNILMLRGQRERSIWVYGKIIILLPLGSSEKDRGNNNGKKLDPKEIVTIEAVILAQAIEQEALVNLLEKKGLINKKELLQEIKKLRDEHCK